MTQSPFIIAEAGVNHNGSALRALDMVDVAADCGADAIKFQTFEAAKLVTRDAAKAAYQKLNTGNGSQYNMLKALEMSEALHQQLYERCSQLGVEFMSTPFDESAADFLGKLGMKRFKIPSGELTNLPFLRHIAGKGKAIILSTGMSTMGEIHEAVAAILEAHPKGSAPDVTILHCTSNYPAAPEELNLRAMNTIAQETALPVGYSDHSAGELTAIAVTALGAAVIEKHFTLDRTLPGPDHKASLEPDELKRYIANVRETAMMLGSSLKAPTPTELETRKVARRSVTIASSICKGAAIKRTDLALRRPGIGLPPKCLDELVGRIAIRDLKAGTQPSLDDFA